METNRLIKGSNEWLKAEKIKKECYLCKNNKNLYPKISPIEFYEYNRGKEYPCWSRNTYYHFACKNCLLTTYSVIKNYLNEKEQDIFLSYLNNENISIIAKKYNVSYSSIRIKIIYLITWLIEYQKNPTNNHHWMSADSIRRRKVYLKNK